jgi:hypothetical protein
MIDKDTIDTDRISPQFLRIVKDNKKRLIAQSELTNITRNQAYRCQHNFFRLLREELGVTKPYLHEVALILNGFHSPRDFTEDTTMVVIPDQTALQKVFARYMTTYPKWLV